MTKRYWVIGGEYRDPNFRVLVPGTETMAGPFENEARAKTEWTRLTCCPQRRADPSVRFSIASETAR